eukprot:SAG31_NODE_682_length_12841_cov_13.637655_5_plen_64_part_00
MFYVIVGCLIGVALVPKMTDLYSKYLCKKTCENLKKQVNVMEQNNWSDLQENFKGKINAMEQN